MSVPEASTREPPVARLAIASLACALVATGWLVAYLPRPAPLAVPLAFLASAVALLVGALAVLARAESLSWRQLVVVARYSALGTLVVAGIAEFVFLYDGTRGRVLALMSAVLLLAALDVPVIFGFSVAKNAASA